MVTTGIDQSINKKCAVQGQGLKLPQANISEDLVNLSAEYE